jgi:hypothetical protein
VRRRAKVGMLLAAILLIPGLATPWTAWSKFNLPLTPSPVPLSLTGAGAFAINLSCAFMLARYHHHGGSLTRAAFLSARNDALANVAIIAAGLVTAFRPAAWPDLIVGLGIATLNADAAREIWRAAREEHRAADASLSYNSVRECWGGRPDGIGCAIIGLVSEPIGGPLPMELKRIAIDTSKHVFTIHGVDYDDRAVLRRELRRVHVAAFFFKAAPTEIVLEACAGSHHWGRRCQVGGEMKWGPQNRWELTQ